MGVQTTYSRKLLTSVVERFISRRCFRDCCRSHLRRCFQENFFSISLEHSAHRVRALLLIVFEHFAHCVRYKRDIVRYKRYNIVNFSDKIADEIEDEVTAEVHFASIERPAAIPTISSTLESDHFFVESEKAQECAHSLQSSLFCFWQLFNFNIV